MRAAAMMLGVIGGLMALMVGFFSYGFIELSSRSAAFAETFGAIENAEMIRIASLISPLLAIAGGAMAMARALWGGVLLLIAGGLMLYAFGLGIFTIFPIGFCFTAGLLALAARRPDVPKAHF
ncbi:hypothetical protein [Paracoccus sediminicola]|uniref:hypothetical protein n=1 Tax=Paracoccus sediminicola TaxID=3017783 RepID=UPI0022F11B27|nr:hypothetical protein [Paracoccus sediminicola]WBU57441.1 hypothetical protein PAF18_03080 [Paracoccus sediminicola]